jgi:hypothetical protein
MDHDWERVDTLAFWAVLVAGVLFPVSVLLHNLLTFLLEREETFFLGVAVVVVPALMVAGLIGTITARLHAWWQSRHSIRHH